MMWLWIGNLILNRAVANESTTVEPDSTEIAEPVEIVQHNPHDSVQESIPKLRLFIGRSISHRRVLLTRLS